MYRPVSLHPADRKNRISLNDRRHDRRSFRIPVNDLGSECKRTYICKKYIPHCLLPLLDSGIHSGADRNRNIRIDLTPRSFTTQKLQIILHDLHLTGSTDHNDLVNILPSITTVVHRPFQRNPDSFQQLCRHLQKSFRIQFHLVNLSANHNLHLALRLTCQRPFQLFTLTDQAGSLFIGDPALIDLVDTQEFLCNCTVHVISAEMIVPGNCHDLDHTVKCIHDRDIQSSSAKVKHQKGLILLRLSKAIGKRCRRRLIDQTLHSKSGKLSCHLRRISLKIIKIRRNTDDCLFNRLTQVFFRIFFQLPQDHGRQICRCKPPVSKHKCLLRPHKTLETCHCTFRMGDQTLFRRSPYQHLTVLINSYYRRC